MPEPYRFPLQLMREVAITIYKEMLPFCEQIRIAGSIRRGDDGGPQMVKDIDIVAVPKWGTRPKPDSLFEEEEPFNVLYEEWAKKQTRLQWIKTGTIENAKHLSSEEIVPWEIDPKGKYWRGYVEGCPPNNPGCCVDIFFADPKQFGLTYFIRTGSKEWNAAVMVHANRVGVNVEDGRLWQRSQQIDTPTERDVFRALGMAYTRPANRNGRDDIQPAVLE